MMDACTIVGVDCATDPKNVGLACSRWQDGKLCITEVSNGQFHPPEETISKWMLGSQARLPQVRCLLAMDAPLGWPLDLGHALAGHRAGMPLITEPNLLFRRETDRFVQRKFRKAPLDVGADRIARTALSALKLLDTLSKKTGQEIPLAWDANFSGTAAIEVYPAGTLRASQIQSSAYKRPEQIEIRRQTLQWLSQEMALPEDLSLPLVDPDALDAMICALAGADFLAGKAYPPTDAALAQKEGWIWIRRPFDLFA